MPIILYNGGMAKGYHVSKRHMGIMIHVKMGKIGNVGRMVR